MPWSPGWSAFEARASIEERSEPAHAALDLVEDQNCAAFVAEPAGRFEKRAIRGLDAALSLHGFHDDGRGRAIDRRFERRDVVEAHEREAAR